MASELSLSATAVYSKGSKRVTFGGTSSVTVAGDEYIQASHVTPLSGATAVAIDKGNVTTLGLFIGRNNGTVVINLYESTAGATLLQTIPVGATVMFFFGSGVTAPAIRSADAATTAELEYLLVEA
jgi:hypothetical protein